ncbi:MAG: beta-lactamase family protein [Bacteroidales bacterium]|nr:beta-lactamase family protein [Bacteroidales bacterium]MCL2132888.1 beta-lactamase family protein [Bacteroidales bacterium]
MKKILLMAGIILLLSYPRELPSSEAIRQETPLKNNLPENVAGQPSKDWYIERTAEIGLSQKVPIIQVAYKTRDRKFFFETANFDFVAASPDVSTVFQVASVSKVVFSYIVLRLVDQGLLDLDRPLYEYTDGVVEERFRNAIPDDAEASVRNEEWAKRLTARMVLTHGTGLPNWMQSSRPTNAKLVFTDEPDTRYTYSGEGFHYLQRVVEHITAKSLNELADEEVFIPLGMLSSSYKWRDEYASSHAYGYDTNNEKGEQGADRPENSAYTLRTNVKDFSLFIEALMEGRGLKRETFEAMLTPQRLIEEPGLYFGLGIRVNPNEELGYGPLWHHSGSNTNFRAMFWLFPQEQTYCIYFTNSANGSGETRQKIYELFFPQYPETTW